MSDILTQWQSCDIKVVMNVIITAVSEGVVWGCQAEQRSPEKLWEVWLWTRHTSVHKTNFWLWIHLGTSWLYKTPHIYLQSWYRFIFPWFLKWAPAVTQHVGGFVSESEICWCLFHHCLMDNLSSPKSEIFLWVKQKHSLNLTFFLWRFSSYWICSPSGIGQPTWLITANPPANTWESTHTLHWHCWRSE